MVFVSMTTVWSNYSPAFLALLFHKFFELVSDHCFGDYVSTEEFSLLPLICCIRNLYSEFKILFRIIFWKFSPNFQWEQYLYACGEYLCCTLNQLHGKHFQNDYIFWSTFSSEFITLGSINNSRPVWRLPVLIYTLLLGLSFSILFIRIMLRPLYFPVFFKCVLSYSVIFLKALYSIHRVRLFSSRFPCFGDNLYKLILTSFTHLCVACLFLSVNQSMWIFSLTWTHHCQGAKYIYFRHMPSELKPGQETDGENRG